METKEISQLKLDLELWRLENIDLGQLEISPMNLRATVYDTELVKSLAEVINEEGYFPNKALLVNKRGDSYRIMAGSNRYNALKLLGRSQAPCYIFSELTEDEEAQYSRLDNKQDERHKPEHFLDVAEAYKRLNENGWTQQRIADAYGEDQSRVQKRIKLGGIHWIAKVLIRNNYEKLLEYSHNWKQWCSHNDYENSHIFKEGHFEEITKLKRNKRIVQICKEIVEHKGDWKHSQIKKRTSQLIAIDDGLRIVGTVMEREERRKLWHEVEKGYHLDLDELKVLVEKLNSEYSRINIYQKSFFDITNEEVPDGSIDLIYADPPYGVSDGGITYHSGKIKSVDKGEWDKEPPDIDEWIGLCYKKLKDGGSIYISGTHHNIYEVGISLKKQGFTIRNEIIWFKESAAPTIIPKYYAFWHETILFATKGNDYYFDAEQIKKYSDGVQMKDVWRLPVPRGDEKTTHSTQKPEVLLERIITASCPVSGKILDPFIGSGTTLVVAKRLRREAVGYEIETEYIEIARSRLR